MQWEGWIGATQTSDEVIFENADGSFCCVATVCVWWYQLKINLIVGEEIFELGGGFVVEAL